VSSSTEGECLVCANRGGKIRPNMDSRITVEVRRDSGRIPAGVGVKWLEYIGVKGMAIVGYS
jgi:hypothetical protein